jgi:hypothetical protein
MGDESSTGIPERSSLFDALPFTKGTKECAAYVARVMCRDRRVNDPIGVIFAFVDDQAARRREQPQTAPYFSEKEVHVVAELARQTFIKVHSGLLHPRCKKV